MPFRFDLAYLNTGHLAGLSITKRVGAHSVMSLQMRHSQAQPLNDLSSLVGQALTCTFEEGPQKDNVFAGLVTGIEYIAGSKGDFPLLQITAYADTLKADLAPRHRVFQDRNGKLRGIVQTVIGGLSSLTAVMKDEMGADFNKPVALSVQYGETDFAYLQRLAGIHGIPLIVDDVNRQLYIGQPKRNAVTIKKEEIFADSFVGSIRALLGDQSYGPAAGAIGQIQSGCNRVKKDAGEGVKYFSNRAFQEAQQLQKESLNTTDKSAFYCEAGQRLIRTRRKFLNVADKVTLEGEGSYTVFATTISFHEGDARGQNFTEQEHTLVAGDRLMTSHSAVVPWQSNSFLAEVTKNEGDPDNLGRVQVRFDWEEEQGSSASKQCWVDVIVPYGGASNEKKETFGFLMLPEVGEKVLVKFIEPWDDKPVLLGSLRRAKVNQTVDTAKYKTIRTPAGSQINLISDNGKEQIQIRAGDSKDYHVNIETQSGKTKIAVLCNDAVSIKGKDILIEGEKVTIHSTNKMAIQSDGPLQVNSNADAKIAANAGMNIQSSALMKLKGAMIHLN